MSNSIQQSQNIFYMAGRIVLCEHFPSSAQCMYQYILLEDWLTTIPPSSLQRAHNPWLWGPQLCGGVSSAFQEAIFTTTKKFISSTFDCII